MVRRNSPLNCVVRPGSKDSGLIRMSAYPFPNSPESGARGPSLLRYHECGRSALSGLARERHGHDAAFLLRDRRLTQSPPVERRFRMKVLSSSVLALAFGAMVFAMFTLRKLAAETQHAAAEYRISGP